MYVQCDLYMYIYKYFAIHSIPYNIFHIYMIEEGEDTVYSRYFASAQ